MIGACANSVSMDNGSRISAAGIMASIWATGLPLKMDVPFCLFADGGAEDEYSLSRNLAYDELARRLEAHRICILRKKILPVSLQKGIDSEASCALFLLFGGCPLILGVPAMWIKLLPGLTVMG